ncbi:MAG TPA: choice-of-anchor D domain-containing protein, partial [Bryobacteraceae bacterium]|nr:choice-of-anchor D domain-containing protein [Bryobacteraceae bacterium]
SGGTTITLLNSGTSYLTLSSITMSGANAADFLASNTCGTTVPSGASCTISISFKPSLAQTETASLVITGSQPNSPTLLPVTGTGVVAVTSGGLIMTPSATSTGENGTVTFSSNRPVNWVLAAGSSGTLTVNSTTSATFQAAASIPATNVMGGCQVTPTDSVFNTRIDSLPVAATSATWTANMGTNGISFLTAWGTNIADSTTPVKSMSFYYTSPYNGPFVFPGWPLLKREGGTFQTRLNSTDHHIVTVRRDNCQFYETYNDWLTPGPCSAGSKTTCNAQSGLTYSSTGYALPTAGATDAAGMPLAPLTVHLDEIKSGVIKHAMRFTVAGGYIHASPFWPSNSGNGCSSCTSSPPYGARFRLKASYNISGFNTTAQVVLTALKQYGMFLADAGTGPSLSLDTDVSEDPATMAAIGQISATQIGMSNFEAVDESSFIVSGNSMQVNPLNGYVTPASFAVVTATDQTNSSYQTSFPVALKPVIVGLPSPTMYIMAGMTGYQLTSWVNGSSNQNVTWSLVSGAGSITAGGLYTPPASVTGPTAAVLQATSAADTNASARLYVTVLPVGSNPTGGIRIDSGNSSGLTDGSGNVWLADQAYESGAYILLGGDYPGWTSMKGNPEQYVWQSSSHTYGNDIVYSFVVPNGNYKVRLMLAQPYNGCSGTCTTFNSTWHAPMHLEANGQIALHNFDFGLPINYAYSTPEQVYIPAQVTNNTLYVALRINLPDIATSVIPSPALDGLQIIPDSSAPYLVIDTQQQTSVTAGNTLQLYATGWYMSNAVSWSLSGPGTISQSGLYTAPTSATSSAQTVTITATSTTSPSVQATATLTIPASGS